jgi:hypothetical protein
VALEVIKVFKSVSENCRAQKDGPIRPTVAVPKRKAAILHQHPSRSLRSVHQAAPVGSVARHSRSMSVGLFLHGTRVLVLLALIQ